MVSCCVYDKSKLNKQHLHKENKAVSAQVVDKSMLNKQKLHVMIPFMFGCWANPVVLLLLLKSSLDRIFNHGLAYLLV